MNLLRRRTPVAPAPAPVDVTPHLEHARQRAYAAEDATRAMQARLDAAIADRRAALVAKVEAEGRAHQLAARVRDLGTEVAALRALTKEGGGHVRCSACLEPMPWGTAHYCTRTADDRKDHEE